MHRIFFFYIPELNYAKKDMNLPFSDTRFFLGQLSQLVTNTIFLSHALRNKIIIRIVVEKPVRYIIQIKSDTIRYLGPEERSLGSLLLKVKKAVKEKLETENYQERWFQPNPGLFVKISENEYTEINKLIDFPTLILVPETSKNQKIKEDNFYQEIETKTQSITKKYKSIIVHYNLLNKNFKPIKNLDCKYETEEFFFSNPFDNVTFLHLFNLILDEKENQNQR